MFSYNIINLLIITDTHIKLKIFIVVCIFLIGCSSQTKLSNVFGTYEGKHLMLYKELTLRADSTYLYSIEGDMYSTPIKQEGFWRLKNKKIKLSASQDYRSMKVYAHDSIKSGIAYFYLNNAQGNPIYDFEGSLQTKDDTYTFYKVKDNQYKVIFRDFPNRGYIKDSRNLYNGFYMSFKGQGRKTGHVYYIRLFVKDELQKDEWSFKYWDGKLYQTKNLEYKKIKP